MTTDVNTIPAAGTRVLVTGAAGGLGTAICASLSDLGCAVAGVDLAGGDGILAADLTDEASVRDAVKVAADRLGGLDAIVGAAGVVDTIHRAERFPAEAFQADLQANLAAQFYVAKAAFEYLRDSGAGSLVLLSSIAAEDGLPGQAAYAAAKAGVVGLVRTLAAEWAPNRIRVNAVLPGLIATPKVLGMPGPTRDRMLQRVPLGRVGDPAELTGTVAYLLSPAAGYVTGQALRVDGGAGLTTTGLHR